MEFGDLMAIITGQNDDASMKTMIIGMLVVEVIALVHLLMRAKETKNDQKIS